MLKKYNSKDHRVPKSADLVKLPDHEMQALELAIEANIPALLIGETGTGKTSAIRRIAFDLKAPYVRVNMSGFTTPDELIGSKSVKDGATYFEHGVITDAMRVGAILVLDEINATSPDCLFILHGLLDEDRQITLPNGEIIRPEEGFRVFATANPDYAGTKGLNQALLDRFPIILEIGALRADEEKELLKERTGIGDDESAKLVEFANRCRTDYKSNKLSIYVSTRSIINVSRLIQAGIDAYQAVTTVIVNKSQMGDERAVLSDVFASVWKLAGKDLAKVNYQLINREDLDKIKKQLNQHQKEIKEMTEAVMLQKRRGDALAEEIKPLQDQIKEAEKRIQDERSSKFALEKENNELKAELSVLAGVRDMIKKMGNN